MTKCSLAKTHVSNNSPAKDLKAKYPDKDWAQVRGRLLGICNLTNEDTSLNKAVNKVCLFHRFIVYIKFYATGLKEQLSNVAVVC